MYPTSATRTSTISVQNDRTLDRNDVRDVAYSTPRFKGYADLLQDTTLEEVLGQPGLGLRQTQIIRHALVDGFFPSGHNESEDIQFFASWLVQHKQAKLLCLWLESTPLSIAVLDNVTAAGLLAIMQSTLSFYGLTLHVISHPKTNVSNDVIPFLVQAFQANASLTRITILSNDYVAVGLSPLFDVLAEVAGLELITGGTVLGTTDFALLGKLVSKNKTLRVLELGNLGIGTFGHGEVTLTTGSAAGVIKQLAGQLQLERLELSIIPPECQAVIGELMCTSHVLKKLKLGLAGSMLDPALIEGFIRTKSVESVHLSVAGLEDGMLILFSGIADGNTSIKSLELITCYPRADRNESAGVCGLISSSRYLASLIWRLPAGCNIDLSQIGMALEKNIRLETLMLIEQAEAVGCDQPGWITETSISALAEKLRKNHTLTELVLASEHEILSPVKKNYSILQNVLDRNRAFQRYACSDEFLCGAVVGFFVTMNLPADPAILTAEALMHYRPRTSAAALALVNKASYGQALFRRRQAHADMLDRLLPIARSLDVLDRREMIELLYGIIATNADFSIADLSRIVESETLPGALVAIMFQNPHHYLYLVKVFCQAVGMPKIRACVIREIAEDEMLDASESAGTGNVFLLSMLQQSFPSDQKHLLPFVEEQLNYDSINSAAVKLFVGYNIPKVDAIGSNKAELASWCVENRQPGVLIAFHDACRSKVAIDFTKYPGAFARGMMDKIPQLINAHALSIKGIPDYEDALVLCRLLAGTSIVKELHIDGTYCGPEFDSIMQGLSLNECIETLTLACRTMPNPPAICDTLASLLEANSTIKEIEMALHDDDPELPGLTQLAARDGRLDIELLEHDESWSESDEAPAQ